MSRKTAAKHKKRVEKGIPFNIEAGTVALIIMFAVIALLLFFGPFQRGLFFPRELLQAQIIIFGLFALWGFFRILKKDNRLIETPLDICLLVLLLAYSMSFIVAVHTRAALEELMKVGAYLVVYLVALDVCRYWKLPGNQKRTEEQRPDNAENLPPGLKVILHLLLAAATVVTIASIGAAAGHWDFAGAYESSRIASPMGYANTAAAYLMAAYFLALGLAPLATLGWQRALYAALAAVMLMTVVLTFSRGAWLLLPPLALVLIVAASPGQRARSFLYLAATTFTAVPAALLADPIFRSTVPARAWIIILAVAVGTVVLALLAEEYLKQGRRLQISIGVAGFTVVAAALIVVLVVPVMSPIHLQRSKQERTQLQYIEQVISNVQQGEEYQLSLEVKAKEDFPPELENPEHSWGIQIQGGLPGYRDEELIDYRGTATDGWEEKVLTFEAGEETTRLIVRLYNGYPGTAVTARSVVLSSADSDQKLRFAMNRVMPDRFYDRIYSYSRDRNLDRRLELFEDAIKVIRDYPVFGAGGGAWNAVYRAYQDQPYSSSEVHNHYLQVWIEAGIFGFIAFVGIWVSFAVAFICNCRRYAISRIRWQYWTAVFLPAAALGAHSIIDWNFSMAAVGIFLFVLFGAGRSLDQVQWFEKFSFVKYKPGTGTLLGIVGLLAGLFLSVYSTVLLNGLDATWESQRLMERGNTGRAISEMDRAIRLDPFRAENYHNLSVLIEDQARRMQTEDDPETFLYLSRQAYELEPFNPNYFIRYGDLLMTYVDVGEGLSYIDRLMEMRPHADSSYVRSAFSRLQIVEYLIGSGNSAEAQPYIEEILEIEQKMLDQVGGRRPIAYIVGRTMYFLDRHSIAEQYYEAVREDDQFYEEAQLRLAEMRGENEADD